MSDLPVQLSPAGPPDTVLPPESPETLEALRQARSEPEERRRDALAAVAARWPRSLEAWVELGALGRDPIERYAYFRVGYHRGLDQLRQAGWRGNGYVRFVHPSNRAFLRALDGLRETAAEIGERDEQRRCDEFLHQLDPEWDSRRE